MSDVCTCGHAEDQHGGDKKYPGSTKCNAAGMNADGDMEPCDCVAYEDREEEDEDEPDYSLDDYDWDERVDG